MPLGLILGRWRCPAEKDTAAIANAIVIVFDMVISAADHFNEATNHPGAVTIRAGPSLTLIWP